MNRIKTLIIDDERPARRVLRGLLEKDADIEIAGEAADGERGLEAIRGLRPDLVFLDVQMPMLTGLELLAQLDPERWPAIVFVTAYDQYALEAFEKHAVDYLLKPFSDARFAVALDRAKQRVRSGSLAATEQMLQSVLAQLRQLPAPGAPAPANDHARLVVKADGQLHFLNQRDIRWVEGQGDFVKIHLKDRTRPLVRMTMNRVEESLDPTLFVRIHKSTIVNLGCVRRIVPVMARSRGMELDDGTQLVISRSYRAVVDRLK
ncbi:MAG: LytTR family DNA-binding domain-containing protein [Opitutus sp.]